MAKSRMNLRVLVILVCTFAFPSNTYSQDIHLKSEKSNIKYIENLKKINNDLSCSKDELRNQLYEAQAKFNVCEQSAEILNDKLKKCKDISLNRLKKAYSIMRKIESRYLVVLIVGRIALTSKEHVINLIISLKTSYRAKLRG